MSAVVGSLVTDLRRALGEKVRAHESETLLYRYDAIASGPAPLAVVLPEDERDVAEVMRICSAHRCPVVPRGAASGLSGGAVPVGPCVSIASNRMKRAAVDAPGRRAVVQPGVVTDELDALARAHGLTYAPDPASSRQSTLGGNVAENAGGPQCLKKGVTADAVLALEVVLADGSIARLDRETGGPDLAALFIGSEGTLGFVTEATVRLSPLPAVTRTAQAFFASLDDAGRAVALVTARGLTPAKLEVMDEVSMWAVDQFLHLGFPPEAKALLLADCDGDDLELVTAEIEAVLEAFREAGAVRASLAATAQEAATLWRARKNVSPALGNVRPNRMNEDIVVPRSLLPSVMAEIHALAAGSRFPVAVFGHAGDGNLHPNILFDRPKDGTAEVEALAHEIARIALRAGGVLSGEHGIGLTKRGFMSEATPAATLDLYRRLKAALDPLGLLNPGKLLPAASR
ncbi:MAG TPA: FAD-linked oxidase C-terminal domain-containing protein [Deinococcales bacterium]|nr:FAD-linked oxidase C-terminal domain-containing protein [Deinococcales bacterium]